MFLTYRPGAAGRNNSRAFPDGSARPVYRGRWLVGRTARRPGLEPAPASRRRPLGWNQVNACSCLTLILACIVYWQDGAALGTGFSPLHVAAYDRAAAQQLLRGALTVLAPSGL